MKQRILTALVLLCILAPTLIFSGTVAFPVIAAIFCLAAVYEMLGCLGVRGRPFIAAPAYVLAFLLPLCTMFIGSMGEGLAIGTFAPEHSAAYLLLLFAAFVIYMLYLFAAAVFCRGSLSFSAVASAFLTTF